MKRVWLVGILAASLVFSLPVYADTADDDDDFMTETDDDEYVDIPDTREKIESGIFTAAVQEDGTVMIIKADFFDDDSLEIPAEIEGHTVTAIGESVFEYGYFFDLEIPDTVTYIGHDAFAYAEADSFTLPENVEIAGDAFCYAKLPERIIIPKGTVTGSESFAYLERTTDIKIEDSVTLGEQCFSYAEELESVEIGDDVVIGREAFSYCDYLESAVIGKQAKIGNEAFSYCESLEYVEIGEGAEMGTDVFYDCYALDDVNMPGGDDVDAPGGDDVDAPGGDGNDKIEGEPANTDTLVDWNIKVVVPEGAEALLDESDGCYYIYPDEPGYIPYVLLKPYEYASVDEFIPDFTDYMKSIHEDLEVTAEPTEKTIGDKVCKEIVYSYQVSGYAVTDRRIATVFNGMTYMFASKEVPELDETVGSMLEDVIADCVFITE